nr:hypothetical protein Iba_chr03eCG0280 [Ipomoea batatas]
MNNSSETSAIPEEIPAAAPAATRAILLSRLFSMITEHPWAQDFPMSTLGPSGPKEQPVPRKADIISGTILRSPNLPAEVEAYLDFNLTSNPKFKVHVQVGSSISVFANSPPLCVAPFRCIRTNPAVKRGNTKTSSEAKETSKEQ